MKEDVFSACHPAVNLYYFAVMLILGMFLVHPVLLGISLLCSCTYASLLKGFKEGVWNKMKILFPMALAVICVNTLFNHYGVTLLFYLPDGNGVTLEAAVYGLVMALVMTAVMQWFSCYNCVMTTDKFVYLFGRILPGLSLILSMCFRYVPCFSRQGKRIMQAQKGIGKDPSQGNVYQKLRRSLDCLSILTTWALENGVDTADSMAARGYGLPGRTAYSLFAMNTRDRILAFSITGFLAVILFGLWKGKAAVWYNPKIIVGGFPMDVLSVCCYGAYLILGMLPVILEGLERRKWDRLRKAVSKTEQKGVRLWEL